nr:hypothetical protein [Tanacetum cinerariifolium]
MNKKQVLGQEYQIAIGPQVAVGPDKPFGAWAVVVEVLLVLPLVLEEVDVMRMEGDDELLSKVVVALESSVNDDSFKEACGGEGGGISSTAIDAEFRVMVIWRSRVIREVGEEGDELDRIFRRENELGRIFRRKIMVVIPYWKANDVSSLSLTNNTVYRIQGKDLSLR